MEWLNLHTSTLDSPEVIGAEPVDRATWLFLLRYCIAQENGGRIANCADWGDRKWQQLVRVTLAEVKKPSELWRFEGNDIAVNFYPVQRQREIEAKRKAGRDTVAKRWESRSAQATAPADSSATSSADSSSKRSADTEGEGEGERKDKGKGKEMRPDAPALALSGEPAPEKKVPAKDPTQLRVEALMRRRPTTPLSPAEAKAYKAALPAILAMQEADWQAMQAFYAAPQSETFTRKDLLTLLNNWNGEVDRARNWKPKAGDEFGSVRAAGWGKEIKIDRSQANSAEPVPFG